MSYIFRWKAGHVCVIPSRRYTVEEVWDYAAMNLIPAFNPPPDPMKYVRERGEVIEDGE